MSKGKMKLRPEHRAILIVVCMFAFLALAASGVVYWALTSDDSESAAAVRKIIGVNEGNPVVEAQKVPEEKTEVVEIEPLVESQPEPTVRVTYSELVSKPRYWPEQLTLVKEKHVEIVFNGKSFGHLDLVAGSIIELEVLSDLELVSGTISGMNVTVPVRHTNLETWFAENFQGRPELIPLSEDSRNTLQTRTEGHFSQSAFMSGFKKWCYLYYESIDFEVTDDTLVFRWQMQDSGLVNYRAEARNIARSYLNQQKLLGGLDNWASCEIRHPETGLVLGRGSVFIPDF